MAEALIIKRGYIYKFEPKSDHYTNNCYALAVSADSRGADNIVSIILLSKTPTPECISIRNNQFPDEYLYCNFGKVTFTDRQRLTEEVTKLSDKKMEKIDRLISRGLGLNPEYMSAENAVYKDLYHELLEKLVNKNGKICTDED